MADQTSSSWDDWVPQDRLRKLTDENRELAANLKKELAAANAPRAAPKPTGKTRRGQGSEFGSGRGSEERTSSVPAAGGRGSKRARDNDIEKVRGPIPRTPTRDISPFSPMMSPLLDTAPTHLDTPDTLGPISGEEMDIDSFTHPKGNSGYRNGNQARNPPDNKLELDMEASDDHAPPQKGRKGSRTLLGLDLDQDLKPYVPRHAAVKATNLMSGTSSKKRPSLDSDFDEPVKKTKAKPVNKKTKTAAKQSKVASDNESESENVGAGSDLPIAPIKIRLKITPKTRRVSLGLRPRQVTNYDEDAEVPDSEDEVVSTLQRSAKGEPAQGSATPTIQIPKRPSTPEESFSPSPDITKTSTRIGRPLTRSTRMSDRPTSSSRRTRSSGGNDAEYQRILQSGQRFTPTELDALIADLNLSFDQVLALPVPLDEPEQISNATAAQRPRIINAPLIGGTTLTERNLIENEMEEAAEAGRVYRPTYVSRRERRRSGGGPSGQDLANFDTNPQIPDDRDWPESAMRETLKHPFDWEAPAYKSPTLDTETEPDLNGEVPGPQLGDQEDNADDNATEIDDMTQDNEENDLDLFICRTLHDDEDPTKSRSEQEDSFNSRPTVRMPMPDNLKNLLVDDWENVTKSMTLVPLPSKAPANLIFEEYFSQEKVNRIPGSAEYDVLEEFVVGMKQYFETTVGKLLLYRFERPQWQDVCSEARCLHILLLT